MIACFVNIIVFRTYKDDAQSVQYLSDLIVCNNLVLSNMGTETPAEQVNLLNHVSQAHTYTQIQISC